MKNKLAFTLSEVLIVLTILGVVVAITLPLLKQATPSQNKMLAKKAYMVTTQIVEEMINDETLYPERNENSPTTVYDGFDNTISVTTSSGTCSGSSKFACLFKTYLNIDSDNTTSDGIKWTISGQTITVDVAADVAGTTDNPDTFSMTVANNGKITINEQWAKDAIKIGTKNHLKKVY